MSWSVALHRSAAPHPPEFARSGAQSSSSAKLTKHELFASVVSGLDETGADAGWKRTFLTEAVAVATSDSAVIRSSAASDGKVWVLVAGELTRDCVTDMRDLYGLPPKEDCDSATLLLDLYEEGFCDKDGDWSDQPATALGVMEGSLSFMLFDEVLGYLLLFRCPGHSLPLYWGTDTDSGEVLLLSARAAPGLSLFPPGCAFESRLLEADPEGWSRMLNVTRHSPAARAVRRLPVVNSRGALCGMMFMSPSGRDLTEATVTADTDVC